VGVRAICHFSVVSPSLNLIAGCRISSSSSYVEKWYKTAVRPLLTGVTFCPTLACECTTPSSEEKLTIQAYDTTNWPGNWSAQQTKRIVFINFSKGIEDIWQLQLRKCKVFTRKMQVLSYNWTDLTQTVQVFIRKMQVLSFVSNFPSKHSSRRPFRARRTTNQHLHWEFGYAIWKLQIFVAFPIPIQFFFQALSRDAGFLQHKK